MATYDLATDTVSSVKTGDIINCSYCGVGKSVLLPKGIYQLEVWGAQGGSYSADYSLGGMGGYSVGTLSLADDSTVHVYAGGTGTMGKGTTAAGGFNGGGSAYSSSSSYASCSGGGGSDIRISTDSLLARVIVAGGGGGGCGYGGYSSSYRLNGGVGGGTSGVHGSQYSTSYKYGTEGTQTTPGDSYYGTTKNSTSYGTNAAFGLGGSNSSSYGYGTGGGGWYGGGYGRRASGGGGSGYVYTDATAVNYPSGCLLDSSMYLTDAQTVAGDQSITEPDGTTATGHAGNGYCRITVIKAGGGAFRINVNGEWKEATPFVNVNGEWKEATPYINVNGEWREAI